MLKPGTSAVVDGSVTWTVSGGKIIATSDANGLTYDSQIGPLDNGTIIADSAYTNFNDVNGLSDNAGDLGYVMANTTYSGYWDAGGKDGDSDFLPNQEAGQWFQFEVNSYATSEGKDYMQVDIYSSSNDWWPVIGSLSLIPEPMTIALLGLGGLFLRRRK